MPERYKLENKFSIPNNLVLETQRNGDGSKITHLAISSCDGYNNVFLNKQALDALLLYIKEYPLEEQEAPMNPQPVIEG